MYRRSLGHLKPSAVPSNCFRCNHRPGELLELGAEGDQIMAKHPAKSPSFDSILRGASALALAFCLSAGAYAQEQQERQQGPPPPPQSHDSPSQQPTYPPQDADKPPYSHDRPRQNAPERRDRIPQPAEAAAPQGQPLAPTLTIPAGTILVTRINEYLSTDHNKIDDPFTATLENPIVI